MTADEIRTPEDLIENHISLRPYEPKDELFVVNSWLYGFRQGCEYMRLIDKKAYFDSYGRVIHLLLERPDTVVKILCLTDCPEIIIGYSVIEHRPKQNILHWVYVKPGHSEEEGTSWRDNGLARMLVSSNITHCTHLTKTGRAILKKYTEVKFNPFLI